MLSISQIRSLKSRYAFYYGMDRAFSSFFGRQKFSCHVSIIYRPFVHLCIKCHELSFGLLAKVYEIYTYIRDDVYKRRCGSCVPSFTTTARLYYEVTTCRSFLIRRTVHSSRRTRFRHDLFVIHDIKRAKYVCVYRSRATYQ